MDDMGSTGETEGAKDTPAVSGAGSVPDDRREALIAAAADVFAEFGYSGARVQQIAERANMTTGAIYNRFSGKSDLLNEALDHYTKALLDELSEANLSASDAMAALGADILDSADSRETMLLLEAFVAARREPEIAARLRPRMGDDRQRLAKLVDEEKVDGTIDAQLDTAAIVTFCQAVGLGMHLLKAIDADLPDSQSWQLLIGRLISSVQPPTLENNSPEDTSPQNNSPESTKPEPGDQS